MYADMNIGMNDAVAEYTYFTRELEIVTFFSALVNKNSLYGC